MSKVKKIYCRKCKFELHPNSKYCEYIDQLNWYLGEHRLRSTKVYLNGNNDCPYYKHKWWKFWVNRDK